jgi:hypothetical protein
MPICEKKNPYLSKGKMTEPITGAGAAFVKKWCLQPYHTESLLPDNRVPMVFGQSGFCA